MICKRELSILIRNCVKASNAKHDAERILNEFCENEWGFVPAQKDLDNILDSVYGGCGKSNGMSSDDFIHDMEAAIPSKEGGQL